jgi:hypothetical protein
MNDSQQSVLTLIGMFLGFLLLIVFITQLHLYDVQQAAFQNGYEQVHEATGTVWKKVR